MPILALGLVLVLAVIVLIPLSLLLRYRAGTARRPARGWLVSINLAGFAISAGVFLTTAAMTSAWVPEAFPYALLGFAGGCLLGLLGLRVTRWEPTTRSLYYTPNRWLVLVITLIVTVRVLYGFWRGWQAWRVAPDETSWLVESGVAGAFAAGAVVLGYYLMYWAGVRHRLKRHRRLATSNRNGFAI